MFHSYWWREFSYCFMNSTIYRIKIVFIILAPIIFLYLLIAAFTYRKTMTAELTDTLWERTILIQRYQTVNENDWSVPTGGRVYDRKWEYRRTYKYKSGSHTEEYACGTNGNPKTCTKEVDEYSSRRVYDWKYYYYIDRWINNRVLRTTGNNSELIEWPTISDIVSHDPIQLGDERAGNPTEKYTLTFRGDKIYTKEVSYQDFLTYHKGKYRITVNIFGGIIQIEKAEK